MNDFSSDVCDVLPGAGAQTVTLLASSVTAATNAIIRPVLLAPVVIVTL